MTGKADGNLFKQFVDYPRYNTLCVQVELDSIDTQAKSGEYGAPHFLPQRTVIIQEQPYQREFFEKWDVMGCATPHHIPFFGFLRPRLNSYKGFLYANE